MQQAEVSAQPATPSPGPGYTWSPRFARWLEPGASPISGVPPPTAWNFKPGESGRQSKGGIISQAVRDELEANPERILKIVRNWLRSVETGDNRAREQLLDRIEGKVEINVNATVESRYVIEEIGVPYVDITAIQAPIARAEPSASEPSVTSLDTRIGTAQPMPSDSAASDNMGYDAHSTGATNAGAGLPCRNDERPVKPLTQAAIDEALRSKKRRGGADPDRRGTEGPTSVGPTPAPAPGRK